MPFTPLHMGPGLALKACLGDRFSLMVFGWSQVIIDIQPLVTILGGTGELHGASHTLVGAGALAIPAAVSGRYLAPLGPRWLGARDPRPVAWGVALASALIGTLSHLLLDAFMHLDVAPLAPLVAGNPLAGRLPFPLEWLCITTGLIGAVLHLGVAAKTGTLQRWWSGMIRASLGGLGSRAWGSRDWSAGRGHGGFPPGLQPEPTCHNAPMTSPRTSGACPLGDGHPGSIEQWRRRDRRDVA